jgi:hypothetical protein
LKLTLEMAVLRDLNSLLTLQNEPPDSPHFLLLIYVGADGGFYHGFVPAYHAGPFGPRRHVCECEPVSEGHALAAVAR